jgi:filamentous hemagglutinin
MVSWRAKDTPMPRLPTSWIVPVIVAGLIVLGISQLHLGGSLDESASVTSSQSVSADDGGAAPAVWSHGHDGSTRNAQEHWQKHGSDFPQYHSAEDYEEGAANFVRSPPPGTLTKHRSNGDTLYYNPSTNTFAVANRNGEPRTYFRPDSGRAYWDRQ